MATNNRRNSSAPQQKNIEVFVNGINIPANREGGYLRIGMALGMERVVLGVRDDFEFINDRNEAIPYVGLIRADDANRGMGITGLFAYSRNRGERDWQWLQGYDANNPDVIFIDPNDHANDTWQGQLTNLLTQIFGEDWDGTPLDAANGIHLMAVGMRPGRFGNEFAYAVV